MNTDEYEDAKKMVEDAGLIDDNDGFLDVHYRKIAHLLAEVKRLREEHKLVWKYVHFERMYDDGLLTVEGEFIGDVKEMIE